MGDADQPVLRVISGDATAEEIAAVVAAVTAACGSGQASRAGGRGPRSAWGDRSALVRRTLPHGPDAWRLNARRGLA
jgi:hypothetical protein